MAVRISVALLALALCLIADPRRALADDSIDVAGAHLGASPGGMKVDGHYGTIITPTVTTHGQVDSIEVFVATQKDGAPLWEVGDVTVDPQATTSRVLDGIVLQPGEEVRVKVLDHEGICRLPDDCEKGLASFTFTDASPPAPVDFEADCTLTVIKK